MRKHFRQICQQIPLAYRESAALAAVDNVTQQEFFKRSEHIACYFYFKDEFDSTPIIKAIWQANKHCYLPIIRNDNTLHFVLYKEGDALQLNRYSISEPKNVNHEFSSHDLDMVITPLVAFDSHGHRLGTGGGYYDRTFAFLHQQPTNKPLMIGLGYSMQEAESIPHDEWDIHLDAIITEKSIIYP